MREHEAQQTGLHALPTIKVLFPCKIGDCPASAALCPDLVEGQDWTSKVFIPFDSEKRGFTSPSPCVDTPTQLTIRLL